MQFRMHRKDKTIQPSTEPQSRILIAAADEDIHTGVSILLHQYSMKTVCVKTVEEVRNALAKGRFAVCFCGFWLVDGTYRDVFRDLRRRALSVPMVLVCGPACRKEYKDYLVSLKLRAFKFISHPYREADLERVFQQLADHRLGTGAQPRQPEAPYNWPILSYPANA